MTRLMRVAAVAAGLFALMGLTACGGGEPSGIDPTPGATETTDPRTVAPTIPTTTTPTTPAATGTLDGTIYLLGVGPSAGGIYYLHSDVLTPVIVNGTFGFFQSVTMSPNGQKMAFVPNDSAGGTGQLRVQTYGGGTVNIGPTTITNLYTPQWSADSSSVVVGYGTSNLGRLDVTSGVLTALPALSGCCFGAFSPDGAYVVKRTGATVSILHADGTSPVTALAPAGQVINRIQSLSPDGHHAIVLLKAVGEPSGDAGRVLAANAILDTTTGTVVALPGGATLRAGFYLANGNAVVRVSAGGADKVQLLSPAGAVLDEVVVPAPGASLLLLGYAP